MGNKLFSFFGNSFTRTGVACDVVYILERVQGVVGDLGGGRGPSAFGEKASGEVGRFRVGA